MTATMAVGRDTSRDRARTGLLLGALVVPGALGVSTVSVALPAISADLGLSRPEGAWLLAGYVLAQAVFVAVFGRVGDSRGSRYVLERGAVLIAVGSILAAFSGSFPPMLLGRLAQGAGAGAIWVAVFGTIAARYDGPARARVIGFVTAYLGIISGSGSFIGGSLTDLTAWRVVIAIPLLALLAIPAGRRLAPPASDLGGRTDLVGAALVAALTSALIVLLQTPSITPPTGVLPVTASMGVLCAALIAWRTRTMPDGFVPAAVVYSPRFVYGSLAALSLFASYLALVYAAPLLLLADHDWSLTRVGLLLVPGGIAGFVSSRVVGRLITNHDPFRIAAVSAALCAAALVLAGLSGGQPVLVALAVVVVLTGFSGGQVALVANTPLAVAPNVRGVATGLYTLMFLMGGAVGSASVAGLTGPLGLGGAVASVALLPVCGAFLARAAGRAGTLR